MRTIYRLSEVEGRIKSLNKSEQDSIKFLMTKFVEVQDALSKDASILVLFKLVFSSCDENVDLVLKTYEWCFIEVTLYDMIFELTWNSREGRYIINCKTFDQYKNLEFEDRRRANIAYKKDNPNSDVEKPNDIGVMTLQKFMRWYNYFLFLNNIFKAASIAAYKVVDDFRKSIKKYNIIWDYNSNIRGRIVKNGIEFKFIIHNTWIEQYIEVRATRASLEVFEQLSNNKYKDGNR